MTEALRLKCPMCGTLIRRVFTRSGGPQDAFHRPRADHRRRMACRFIVTPDVEGTSHRFERVPQDMSIEDLIEERCVEWKLRQAVGVA